MIRRIGFIGLGLIGGSLAKLIRERVSDAVLIGVDVNPETCRVATELSLFDDVVREISLLPTQLDLVLVCTPLQMIMSTVEAVSRHLESDVIISDVGSLKASLGMPKLDKPSHLFVPGHPMAGTEYSGFSASSAAIMAGARYVLCPQIHPRYSMLEQFLQALGFHVIALSAEDHDHAVGLASHYPYLMACLTMANAQKLGEATAFDQVVSSGFRDTTRVAGSSPDWGTDVCLGNRKTLIAALESTSIQLAQFKIWLETGDAQAIRDFLAQSRESRERLFNV